MVGYALMVRKIEWANNAAEVKKIFINEKVALKELEKVYGAHPNKRYVENDRLAFFLQDIHIDASDK